MADETTAGQSESTAATEDVDDDAAAESASSGEKTPRARRDRESRRDRDFGEFAFRELRRARKLFTATDEANEAEFAVQMAQVSALLAVADAIRGAKSDAPSDDSPPDS